MRRSLMFKAGSAVICPLATALGVLAYGIVLAEGKIRQWRRRRLAAV